MANNQNRESPRVVDTYNSLRSPDVVALDKGDYAVWCRLSDGIGGSTSDPAFQRFLQAATALE